MCKRSVHTAKVVRRLLNTLTQLDWELYVAPILTATPGGELAEILKTVAENEAQSDL